MKPISGVYNCHVRGLNSFMMTDNLRVFVSTNWTPLSVNYYGDAVGFHNHHRDIELQILYGEIFNVQAFPVIGQRHPFGFNAWEWDSSLRGGKGKFTKLQTQLNISPKMLTTCLAPDSPAFPIRNNELHTVVQYSKVAAWAVTESGPSMSSRTLNWSRGKLDEWSADDLYVPMKDPVAAWNQIKPYVKRLNDIS